MTGESKQITGEQMEKIIGFLTRYKSIHEHIGRLEEKMAKIQEEKDDLLKDLELARTDEQFFMSQLEAQYGPGMIDPRTLRWVTKETTDFA